MPANMTTTRTRRFAATVTSALVASMIVLVAGPASPVEAAPLATLNAKSVAPVTDSANPALPGTEFVYTINYSCSGLVADTCAGAVITDPLPTFTDIYGNTNQLQLVSGSASTPSDWTFQNDAGPTGVVPNQTVSWVATTNLVAGDSGAVTLTLRVPVGIVPDTTTPQQVDNVAELNFASQAPDPSETAAAFIDANPPGSTLSKSGPGTATLNAAGTADISHTITICPSIGSPLWENYTVTDTLPPGVTVSTSPLPFGGVFTPGTASTSVPGPNPGDPDVITPGTGGSIVWNLTPTNRPAVTTAGCLPISFDVNYVNAAAGGDLTNTIGETKTNTVEAVGSNGAGGSQNIGAADTTLTLDGPRTIFSASKNTGGNFYVQDGDTVSYNLGASNRSDTEAPGFTEATLTDGPFPPGFALTQIDTGTWEGADVTASVETSPNGSAWTQVSTAQSTTITAGLAGVQYVRWVFNSPSAAIARGWDATGQTLTGTINGAPPPSVTRQNCVALEGIQSGVTQTRPGSCANVELESPQPHPDITKAAPGQVAPGETVTYTLTAANDGDATGDIVGLRLTDCVPYSERLIVSNVRAGGAALPASGWSVVTPPTPATCTPTRPNTANSGTLIVLDYSGTLTPGQVAPTITYDVTANDFEAPGPADQPALPGRYDNTVTITQSGGTPFAHCVQVDCSATERIRVPVSPVLRSEKFVRGSLDNDFNKAGTTTAGGQVTWRLEVQNIGNVEVEDVQYVDVFGHVGDRGVVVDQPRGSEYTPYLTSLVTASPGWLVEYSTSNRPCRPEVLGPNNPPTDCDLPNWTSSPDLSNLPSYRSVRFTFSGRILIAQTLAFEYDMVTPVFDPTYDIPDTSGSPYDLLADCSIPDTTPPFDPAAVPGATGPGDSTLLGLRTEEPAWIDTNGDGIQQPGEGGPTCPRSSNSFAYGVTVPSDQLGGLPNPGRLSAEPPQVDLHVAAAPAGNVIGSRVWEDLDNDGIQDDPADEPGVPFVQVDLYTAGGTYVDTTFTDFAGNYVFEQLPDGDYVVRFYMPDDRGYISPQDQSGVATDQLETEDNTDDDSDIPQAPTGTDAMGNYYETAPVTLGNDPDTPSNEADPSWDAGIWLPAPDISLKKYVNGDDAQVVTGPDVPKGQPVTWTYGITNTGNTFLANVTLTDVVTISGESDPMPVCNWSASSDPATAAGLLSRGETVTCTASDVAITGQYGNDADVVGTTVLDDGVTPVVKVDAAGNAIPATVTDDDPAHYFGVEYDLALAKVADVTSVNQGGTVVWTIRVVNQGNVDSGEYTVTDVVPAGLTVTGTTATVTPVSATNVGRTYTWVLPNLTPGATADIEITTTVADINQRPFRNWAEISADSSATYSTTDFDSTPNVDVGDDDAAGTGTDPDDDVVDNISLDAIPDTVVGDEDDNDLAEVTGTVLYDLALVKTVDTPLVPASGLATWTITVKNQGDVDSQNYEITDNLPAGLTIESATPLPTSTVDRTSTWTMPNLAPGDTTTVTIVTSVTDQSVKPFVNWAEISADGAAFYSTVAGTVNDVDSTPDANIGDDPGVGTGSGPTDGSGSPENNVDRLDDADVDTDLGAATDEDDSDQAVLNSNVLYDLALVKTVDSALVLPGDTITWTIEVLNQGNVISGEYTVTDVVPNGLAVTGTSASVTPVSETNVDRTYTFVMPSLDPGGAASITITTTISDINMRPYRNWAEISDDSADELFGAVDSDSTPDANTGDDDAGFDDFGADPNDVVVDQTTLPTVQFNDSTIDEDDNDLAEVAVDIAPLYDLALVKTVDDSGIDASDLSAGTATFSIEVQNQGNVPSGDFTITDQVPAGLEPGVISDGGTYDAGARTIVWTVDQLLPTVTTIVTYEVSIVDVSAQPFRNIAEISADSAADYAATDVDSTPDAIVANDGVYPPLLSDPGTGIDNVDITEAGNDGVDDEDDADIADLIVPVVYDLALAKTVDSSTVEPDGTVSFEVVVQNQGNVDSNEFTVTDRLPDGLALEGPFTGTYDDVDHTLTWAVAQLAPGESESFTFAMSVSDARLRPYRNSAEISADSADDYDAGGLDDLAVIDVEDADSTPDDDSTNDGDYGPVGNSSDVDNDGADAIDQAGLGPDGPPAGEDDADIADVTLDVRYDLALVKVLPPGQDYSLGRAITYRIDVMNQGNVDSGEFRFVDQVPDGMSFVSASDGGEHAARAVTWTVANLSPGEVRRVTVQLRLDDVTLAAYENFAEITEDSADDYSTPDDPVTDDDSTPDSDVFNDRVTPTDDVTTDLGSTDEDDHDVEPLDTAAVSAANPTPDPTTELPRTGSNGLGQTLLLAALALVLGALFLTPRSRRSHAA